VLNLARESGQTSIPVETPEEIIDFSFLREIRRERGESDRSAK